MKKGYIAKDSAGIKAEDMGVAFISGKFPIMVSGSWWYGRFADGDQGLRVGHLPVARQPAERPAPAATSGSCPRSAKNKDLAYDFIDITMSKEIQNLLGNSGGVPVAADPAAITDPKSKELIENFNSSRAATGWRSTPTGRPPATTTCSSRACRSSSTAARRPQQVLDEIAEPYNDNLADIGN